MLSSLDGQTGINTEVATRRFLLKKVLLKIFENFTGKHLFYFIKLEAFRPATLLKTDSTQMFFCAICETFKNTYFEEHLQMAASVGKKTVRTSIENEKEQNSEKARAILLVS